MLSENMVKDKQIKIGVTNVFGLHGMGLEDMMGLGSGYGAYDASV